MDRPSKKTKHTVMYQYMPSGIERCSGCSMFVPSASCTDVEGVIDKNGWCQLWRPKSNPHERLNTRLR